MGNIAAIVSVFSIIRQFRETRYPTYAQGSSTAARILQDVNSRKAWKLVFEWAGKPLTNWKPVEKEAVEILCYSYDIVGQMTQYRLLPKDIVIDSCLPSLRKSWPILSGNLYYIRKIFYLIVIFDHYEWLVIEAWKYNNRRKMRDPLITRDHIRQILTTIKSVYVRILKRGKVKNKIRVTNLFLEIHCKLQVQLACSSV